MLPRLLLTDVDMQAYAKAARQERAQMIGELVATAIVGVVGLFRRKR